MKTKDEILQEEIDKLAESDPMYSPYYQNGDYDGCDLAILSAMEVYANHNGVKDRGFCDYLIGYIVAGDFMKELDDIYNEYLKYVKT